MKYLPTLILALLVTSHVVHAEETNDIDVKTGGFSTQLKGPIPEAKKEAPAVVPEKMTWKRIIKATGRKTKNVAKGCAIWNAQTVKNDWDWWADTLSNPKVNTATGTGSNLVGLGWYGSNWIIRR